MFKSDIEYGATQIKEKLVGTKIIDAIISDDEGSYGFRVEAPDGRTGIVWVDCDPEGNGPGWLALGDSLR